LRIGSDLLNLSKTTPQAIASYQNGLSSSWPNHLVIDGLFDDKTLSAVLGVLQKNEFWQTQQHTYSSLYVDQDQWHNTKPSDRFVQRDAWQRLVGDLNQHKTPCIAEQFLQFLRSDAFMTFLSAIFNVALTDKNVESPNTNSNYFRLSNKDFVRQHADDSPGREVCLLLYLNKGWQYDNGGELYFKGGDTSVKIAPLYNRCVLFNPASSGAEHWVEPLANKTVKDYRYNVTSWYWSE